MNEKRKLFSATDYHISNGTVTLVLKFMFQKTHSKKEPRVTEIFVSI